MLWLLALVSIATSLPAVAEGGVDARALASAVVQNQRTSGSRTRARLAIEPAQGPQRSLQILIKERRHDTVHETLVVALWPKEEKGRAWMIRRTGSGALEGFRLRPPDEVTPLSSLSPDETLFGSDLGLEDFVESFWDWPELRVVGEEKVGSTPCWVLESRSAQGGARHPLVRSWLAKDRPVALRIEKLDTQGAVAKRITAGRVVRRDDGGWSVAEWVVETVATGSRTKVTGSRSDRDLDLSDGEFTPEGVRKLLAP